jgi:hypothetical protein
MAKMVTKNQYFDRGDGQSNFLVVEDWSELGKLPAGTRVWITASQAIAFLDQQASTFYGWVNKGDIESHFLKTSDKSYRGFCLVPLEDTLKFGVKEFERRATKELPSRESKLRRMGVSEAQIESTIAQYKAATEAALQGLRDGAELLLKGMQFLGEGAVNEAIV